MPDAGVREARRADIAAITDVQVRCWSEGYRDVLPAAALAEATGPDARKAWLERWTAAVLEPPTPRHRVLVADQDGLVTGLTAHAPAADPDLDPADTAELLTLLVDPLHSRAGHGSRLLAATADLLRDDGVTTVIAWVFAADRRYRDFLGAAGWALDGATRTLDLDGPVEMVRLHTDISAQAAP